MENILNTIKNSVLFRFCYFVISCVRNSVTFKAFASLFEIFKNSQVINFIRNILLWFWSCIAKFINLPCSAPYSVFAKISSQFGKLSEKICYPLNIALKTSFFKKCWQGILHFLSKSVCFSFLKKDATRRLAIGSLALYIFLDYFFRNILSIGFLASTWDEALLLVLAVYAFILRGLEPTIYKNRQSSLGANIILFMGCAAFLGLIVCQYPSISLDGYRAVCQYMLWFFVAFRIIRDKDDFMFFAYTLTGLSFILCLYGIYQFIVATPIPTSWTTSTEQGVRTRVFSITTSPNIFGSFIVMTSPIVAGLIYRCKNFKHQLILWCVLGAMCLSCIFTFSRGAWGGAFIAVVIFALVIDKRLLVLMGTALLAIVVAVPSAVNRITYLFTPEYVQASSTGGRIQRWAYGMEILNMNNPWFGFGLGRYGGAVAMQNKVDYTLTYSYMDNYYLKTLVEMGYIGLAFFVLLLIAFFVWSLRAVIRTKGEADHPVVCGMFAGLCGVLVHCYFENIFEVPYMSAYFWIIAAFIFYRGFIANRNSGVYKIPSEFKWKKL